jgi:AcrR family transcriptional regulator
MIQPAPAQARPSRRERKKREARHRIYEAAVHLFVEKGFDRTTVGEIAERADVAKGTVFNYFPHKTSFLAALAGEWTDRLVGALGPVASWRGATGRKLERLFLFLADLAMEDPAVASLAMQECVRQFAVPCKGPPLAEEEGVQRFQELTRAILRIGQATGDLRRGVDVREAAGLIESAFFRTLARWLAAGGNRRLLHREITARLDIVLNGLVARGGMRVGRAVALARHQRGR